jgi:hypothetical protein
MKEEIAVIKSSKKSKKKHKHRERKSELLSKPVDLNKTVVHKSAEKMQDSVSISHLRSIRMRSPN